MYLLLIYQSHGTIFVVKGNSNTQTREGYKDPRRPKNTREGLKNPRKFKLGFLGNRLAISSFNLYLSSQEFGIQVLSVGLIYNLDSDFVWRMQ